MKILFTIIVAAVLLVLFVRYVENNGIFFPHAVITATPDDIGLPHEDVGGGDGWGLAGTLPADVAVAGWTGPVRPDPKQSHLRRRPVVFVFASHLLGTTLKSMLDVIRALSAARRAFEDELGVPPYLIGEETVFRAERDLSQQITRSVFKVFI